MILVPGQELTVKRKGTTLNPTILINRLDVYSLYILVKR